MSIPHRKLCIVGAGGFGREVFSSFKDNYILEGSEGDNTIVFLDDDPKFFRQKVMGIPVIQTPDFNPSEYDVAIAVGAPQTRKKIVAQLPANTHYITLIHPSAIIMADCEIGEGSIITAGCTITCNIRLGKHTQLNLHTTVGHDCRIGDYFTTAPGTHISGECTFGDGVYFGTNASVRQGVQICDDVTIGMGGVVVKNIEHSGVYIGNPLRKLEK